MACWPLAAVRRRVNTVCKHEAGLGQQLVLYQVYYNFCLPHTSLRQPLPQPQPTNGKDSARPWQPCIETVPVVVIAALTALDRTRSIIRTQQVRDPVTGALSTSLTGRVPAGQRRLSQGP
jgi:hypothetical protein